MSRVREFLHLGLGLRQLARRITLSAAEASGLTIIRTRTRDEILDFAPWTAPYFSMAERVRQPNRKAKPSSALDSYLRRENPRLAELHRRYAGHPAAQHVHWSRSAVQAHIDLSSFRADNLYVFQSRRYPPSAFYTTAAYVKEVDRLNLLSVLQEDDCFGAETFDFHGKTVSRDLLDSILEINFLEKHLRLLHRRAIKFIDIGAGYGRLAHRMASAAPGLGRYFCIDAVPESTFISDYYLRFRKMADRCCVVPLDMLDQLSSVSVDLAVNVHTFPECRASVTEWWLDRLREMQVPWLFIEVGSNFGLTSYEPGGARKDFLPAIESSGFKLVVKEHKFEDAPVLQRSGLYPADYFLFRRI